MQGQALAVIGTLIVVGFMEFQRHLSDAESLIESHILINFNLALFGLIALILLLQMVFAPKPKALFIEITEIEKDQILNGDDFEAHSEWAQEISQDYNLTEIRRRYVEKS
jgi:hypothetical protein